MTLSIKNIRSHVLFAKQLVRILDTKFQVAGIRFGIDPLFDLIPGAGSFVASLTSCYLFWIAYQLKVPAKVYVRMAWNIGLDTVLGLIPIAGIAADLLYKSNVRNFALLEKYFDPDILVGEVVDA